VTTSHAMRSRIEQIADDEALRELRIERPPLGDGRRRNVDAEGRSRARVSQASHTSPAVQPHRMERPV
ncbi:MAG: hypothetical protein ABIR80_00100, partial [Opitutaceae bacterium]